MKSKIILFVIMYIIFIVCNRHYTSGCPLVRSDKEKRTAETVATVPSTFSIEKRAHVSVNNKLVGINEEELDVDDSDNEENIDYEDYATHKRENKNNQDINRKGPKVWDHWGKWSACSVTCGIGKITRWRHCVSGGCASGEKEAQLKSCTLPAC